MCSDYNEETFEGVETSPVVFTEEEMAEITETLKTTFNLPSHLRRKLTVFDQYFNAPLFSVKSENMWTWVASKGHLHVMKTLHNHTECDTKIATKIATQYGQLHVLKWLVNHSEDFFLIFLSLLSTMNKSRSSNGYRKTIVYDIFTYT